MPLTCECDVDDPAWYWTDPDDYSTLNTARRRRCKSCGALIEKGATVTRFARIRYPASDLEERIHGEGTEINIADWFHCEPCADLFYSLRELGFCVAPNENMRELVREYAAMRRNTSSHLARAKLR